MQGLAMLCYWDLLTCLQGVDCFPLQRSRVRTSKRTNCGNELTSSCTYQQGLTKGAPGVIACRHGLHGLQFEAWSQMSDMPSNSGNMGEKYFQEFGPIFYGWKICSGIWPHFYGWKIVSGIWSQNFDMPSASGYMGEKIFSGTWSQIFDMSSASGYMGEKYVQEFGPKFLACRPALHDML